MSERRGPHPTLPRVVFRSRFRRAGEGFGPSPCRLRAGKSVVLTSHAGEGRHPVRKNTQMARKPRLPLIEVAAGVAHRVHDAPRWGLPKGPHDSGRDGLPSRRLAATQPKERANR
jgi:hypothetical protein